jgi:hypothetical protein
MTLVKINNKQSTIINQNTPLSHRLCTRLVTSVTTLKPAFAHFSKKFKKIPKNRPHAPKTHPFSGISGPLSQGNQHETKTLF